MRGKLVVGNWKMHGGLRQNDALLADLRAGWQPADAREIAVCVPFPYLWQAQAALSGSAIAWGAQNVSEHPIGAHTGEVAATMVAEFGCRYAIVGHSERRAMHGETDDVVAAKAAAALDAGLVPIVCVGETLEQRQAGETKAIVLRQLAAVIARLGTRMAQMVVAYEPVWAIGTGKTATPQLAQEAHAVIKSVLDVPVLYGGSVKPDNAAELLSQPSVDGALVGGASLDPESLAAICRAAIPS